MSERVEAFSSQNKAMTTRGEQNLHQTKEQNLQELDEADDMEDLEDEYQRKMDEQFVERMIEKNKQIERLLDELRDVEIVNLELTNQCKKLKLELKNATNEIQIGCNQMEMLCKQIEELKQLNEDFMSEKKFMSEEIERLQERLNRYESGDESIVDKYAENVEQLKQLIQVKDEEIVKLKSSQLVPEQSVRDLQKKMNKELKEKNKQIELLKTQLNEAVNDIESQTEIIRRLHKQNKSETETIKLNQEIQSLSNQIKNLEEEMLAKDQELLTLRKKVNAYEKGEYGLKDALKEINDLNKHLQNRDQRIEEMVQQINSLKLQLNAAEDAIDGIKSYEKQTTDETKFSKKERIKILEMERRILELEDQKIALTEKLRSNINKSAVDKQEEYKEICDLRTRLQLVEDENRELQLGMKEILNGIRETDAMSDVIIECPTLDRLCTLLESRSIASDLTNVIALKAELDLVRGHNEQLRTDIRHIRSDYMKVIAQYTQDLLDSDIPFDQTLDETLVSTEDNEGDQRRDAVVDQNIVIVEESLNGQEPTISTPSPTTPSSVIDVERMRQTPEEEQELSSVLDSELVLITRETQTIPTSEFYDKKIKIVQDSINVFTQTDPIDKNINKSGILCQNCPKLMKIIEFLKKCVEKLELNIRNSENKYLQRLELLQRDNKNLIDNLNERLIQKDVLLNEKEALISELQQKLNQSETNQGETAIQTISDASNVEQLIRRPKSPTPLSASCKTVLESVINCLQARLEHKDESIRQYRNMLSEAKQNFENEMIRLIDSNRQTNETKINLTQMIDNEELESALNSCVNELEECKTELNSKIRQLEAELEAKSAKLMAYQSENEELRHKRITPSMQYKTIIEQLKEELKQKDSVINTLNKTIKDERAMRAVSTPKRTRDGSAHRERKVDNELFQEIANLRQIIETQKKSVNDVQVLKWNYEKTIKDIKEEAKSKLKDKESETMALKEKIDKLTVRVNKAENEKMSLQSKINKKDASVLTSNKAIQTVVETSEQQITKLKNDLKKYQKEFKQKESETNALKKDLDLSRQIESELKTLLEESLKREKLATIQEESKEVDTHYDKLLQENARIKVELRMAEFELKKRIQK